MPGTGGALATGGAADLTPPPAIMGADLSFVTVFFSLVPFVISERRALYQDISRGTWEDKKTGFQLTLSLTSPFAGRLGRLPDGGGGGGGPPIPPGGGGGGGGGGILVRGAVI